MSNMQNFTPVSGQYFEDEISEQDQYDINFMNANGMPDNFLDAYLAGQDQGYDIFVETVTADDLEHPLEGAQLSAGYELPHEPTLQQQFELQSAEQAFTIESEYAAPLHFDTLQADPSHAAPLQADPHQYEPPSPPAQYQQLYEQYAPVSSIEDPNLDHSTSSSFVNTGSSTTFERESTATTFEAANDDDNFGLKYSTLEEAMKHADPITKPEIENDDWVEMAERPKPFVQRLVNAFKEAGLETPSDRDLEPEDQVRFEDYQHDHFRKVNNFVTKRPRVSVIEIAAWKCFGAIIEAHEIGIKNFKATDFRRKCSVRFHEVAEALEAYTIFRWDIIRGFRIEDLVTDPAGATNRKLTNFGGNLHKVIREKQNNALCTAAGIAYNPVLGSKRKSTGGKRKSVTATNFPRDTNESDTEEVIVVPGPSKVSKKRKASRGPTSDEEFTPDSMRPNKRRQHEVITISDDEESVIPSAPAYSGLGINFDEAFDPRTFAPYIPQQPFFENFTRGGY